MPFITTDIYLALQDLQQGKPVAIPTETVYGLAAPINDDAAIRQVFQLKQRPLNHPLIVHIAKNTDINNLVSFIPAYAKSLMQHFWPGPLTLVFKLNPGSINSLITGDQETVAIRSPKHDLTQQLLSLLAIPVAAPSANPFGKISPTTAEHVASSFPAETLTILDGGRCSGGIESTIIDVTHEEYYQILRPGIITEEAIKKVIQLENSNKNNEIRVPGKLEQHYQPQKPFYSFDSEHELKDFCMHHAQSGFILAKECPPSTPKHLFYCLPDSANQLAFDLYYQLRLADASPAQFIAIVLPPAIDAWRGVRERIQKASVKGVVNKSI